MNSDSELKAKNLIENVSSGELNAWRRGFTPQAEIWNGRMAMIGLALGLSALTMSRILFGT